MGTTQLAICNTGLELVKSQAVLTGGAWPAFTGGDPATLTAANTIYGPVRDLLLREINPEFARITIVGTPLTPAIVPWAYEYAYPVDGVRIRQVRPPALPTAGALADPNERLPIPASVAFDTGPGVKVVLTNQQNALLVYTSNLPPEGVWDGDFAEAMADRLSRYFAMAIAGRPDWARQLLEEAERYAGLAQENTDL